MSDQQRHQADSGILPSAGLALTHSASVEIFSPVRKSAGFLSVCVMDNVSKESIGPSPENTSPPQLSRKERSVRSSCRAPLQNKAKNSQNLNPGDATGLKQQDLYRKHCLQFGSWLRKQQRRRRGSKWLRELGLKYCTVSGHQQRGVSKHLTASKVRKHGGTMTLLILHLEASRLF